MMTSKDRADAINRAGRAFKALADHPESTRRQLGAARERVNDCYRLPEAEQVLNAVTAVENAAARLHGVPQLDEATSSAASAPIRPALPPTIAPESVAPTASVAR